MNYKIGCDDVTNSMTGFGREVRIVDGTVIAVEIRSVNQRFLDISLKLPQAFSMFEDKIKKNVQRYFSRGRIEVFISIEGKGFVKRDLQVDWNLFDQYITMFHTVQSRYDLADDVTVAMIPKLNEVLAVQETDQETDELKDAILVSVEKACQQVWDMRIKEGQALKEDMVTRIEKIEKIINMLGERRETVIIEYRERIQNRIKSYTLEMLPDDNKIYHEIALLAEKGDITEEVTRLHSHLKQFSMTVDQEQVMGRKLEFILQEMLRETNTIGSKSNDSLISEWVVTLKTEMEKLKEQILNVE